jgi:hypothetical protein
MTFILHASSLMHLSLSKKLITSEVVNFTCSPLKNKTITWPEYILKDKNNKKATKKSLYL